MTTLGVTARIEEGYFNDYEEVFDFDSDLN